VKPRLKGVYKLNPTRAVMKSGSRQARRAVTEDVPGFKKVKRPTQGKGTKR
jgi:hypothetical protein